MNDKFAVGLIFAYIFIFAFIIGSRSLEMGKNLTDTFFISGAFILSQSFTRIRWFQRKMNPELKEFTFKDLEKVLDGR